VVEKSKRVLFVLQTSFTYELEIARRLRAVLVETFPRVEIELRIMQMGAENASTIIEDDGLLRFYTYPRPHNIVYDNQFTSVEWHWMDEVRVRTMHDPEKLWKSSLLIKWLYKIWRNLGKRLRKKRGGVRLHAFPEIRVLYLTAFVTRKGLLCLCTNIMEVLNNGIHRFR
jgi:hypothetical protein